MTGWTEMTFEVTTPLFNNGPGNRCDAVRVPSLRGALRFWLRALAGRYLGSGVPAIHAVAEVERKVFGDTANPSPIALRLADLPIPATDRSPSWTKVKERQDSNRWLWYLLGQGLYQVPTKQQRGQLKCDYLDGLGRDGKANASFRLQAQFSGSQAVDDAFLCALWALASYGGLGARVRRGFGGIRLAGSDSLPNGWTLAELKAPSLQEWNAIAATGLSEHIDERLRQALDGLLGRQVVDQPAEVGTYPQLNDTNWKCTVRNDISTSWVGVLSKAGRAWREFRATEHAPGVLYEPQLKTWEWTNTIHGDSQRFPIGATGLPIGFKGGHTVAPLVENQSGRRPSPIWFRPVGDGLAWKLLTFAFRHEFLPVGVPVQHGSSPVTVTQQDLLDTTDAWLTGSPRPLPPP